MLNRASRANRWEEATKATANPFWNYGGEQIKKLQLISWALIHRPSWSNPSTQPLQLIILRPWMRGPSLCCRCCCCCAALTLCVYGRAHVWAFDSETSILRGIQQWESPNAKYSSVAEINCKALTMPMIYLFKGWASEGDEEEVCVSVCVHALERVDVDPLFYLQRGAWK